MAFGDFNHDGHRDGRDYTEYKIATDESDDEGSGSFSNGSGNIGCLTFVLIVVALYVILEIMTG